MSKNETRCFRSQCANQRRIMNGTRERARARALPLGQYQLVIRVQRFKGNFCRKRRYTYGRSQKSDMTNTQCTVMIEFIFLLYRSLL